MSNLPQRIIPILRAFETVFSTHVWEWARVLLIGAILAPGERPAVSELSSRPQSSQMVEPSPEPDSVARVPVCARERPGGGRDR